MQQPQSPPPQPQSLPAQPQPIMVQVSPPPAETQDLGNVIVGAFGLTGALVLGAVVSGATLASLWILYRKWRRTYDVDAPPTLGSMPLTSRPPSDRLATRQPLDQDR